MPLKRPAAAAVAGSPAPSRRKSTATGPPASAWRSVAKAVGSAEGLPEDTAALLETMVGQALGVYKSDRHPFQEKIVARAGEALAATEKALEAKQAAASAAAADVGGEQQRRDQLCAEATTAEASLKEAHLEAGKALEAATAGVDDARGKVSEAEAAEKENIAAAAKMAKDRAVIEEHKLLLGAPAAPSKKELKSLLALGETLGLDDSLLQSVEITMSKAVEERSAFDKIIISSAEAAFGGQAKDLGAKIMAALAAKEPCAQAVTAAKAALEAAEEKLKASKTALAAAEEAHAKGVDALKEAQHSAKRVFSDIKKLCDSLDNASAALEAFRTGPLAKFKELQDAEAPPPPPAEPAEAPAAPIPAA